MPRTSVSSNSSRSNAPIDHDLKQVKLAIEREKLSHLKIKTASFPQGLTDFALGRQKPAPAAAKTRDTDENIFERCLELSLTNADLLPAMFKYRRELGYNDTQFLTDELLLQYAAQLED